MLARSEIWKPVDGFPGYEVSDRGNVRGPTGRILKPSIKPRSIYHIVGLYRDGKRHPFTVHRLVMDTFVGLLPDGYDRSHLDGDSANNSLSNLAFEPKPENNQRKVQHGTAQRGERGTLAKLTNDQVGRIRTLSGMISNRQIAKQFGVNRSTIDRIVSRKTWFHLADQFHGAPLNGSLPAPQPGEEDGDQPL